MQEEGLQDQVPLPMWRGQRLTVRFQRRFPLLLPSASHRLREASPQDQSFSRVRQDLPVLFGEGHRSSQALAAEILEPRLPSLPMLRKNLPPTLHPKVGHHGGKRPFPMSEL